MPVTSVTVRTVTPIFTGDAYGEYSELKPQSILGSLRFWFEVYCYAIGKLVGNCREEKIDSIKFLQIISEVITQDNNISLAAAKKEALERLKISLPSQFFGCNGWEGLIKIKTIKVNENNSSQIHVPGNIYKEKADPKAPWFENYFKFDRKTHHSWYFPKEYFYGNFEIEFWLSEDSLKNTFLFPLLFFIEKYGFVGGKNNIGFGRVKIKLDHDELSSYNTFNLNNEVKSIDEVIEEQKPEAFSNLFNDKLLKNKRIGLLKMEEVKVKEEDSSKFFIKTMKKLIRIKSEKRYEYKRSNNNTQRRHYIFGSTKGIEGPNATKIIPWINQVEENKYETGFISLVLLEDFPKEMR